MADISIYEEPRQLQATERRVRRAASSDWVSRRENPILKMENIVAAPKQSLGGFGSSLCNDTTGWKEVHHGLVLHETGPHGRPHTPQQAE
jgi:hypothetical protein